MNALGARVTEGVPIHDLIPLISECTRRESYGRSTNTHIHISCRSGVSKQTCGCAKHQHAATAPLGLCVQAAMVHSLCMSHHHTYYVTSSYILCVQAAMVCVCGCEKEREKERERGREKEGKRERVCVCAAKGRAPKRLTHESSRLCGSDLNRSPSTLNPRLLTLSSSFQRERGNGERGKCVCERGRSF